MMCHVSSWSGGWRPALRVFRPVSCFRHSLSFPSVFVPFPPPTVCPSGGSLFRAYRARAGAPVGAGAVRAPDCARAQEPRRRTHVTRRFNGGLFSRRRETGKEAAPRTPPPSSSFHTTTDILRSNKIRNYCEILRTRLSLHAPGGAPRKENSESRGGPRYRIRSGTVRVRRPAPPRRSRAGPGRRTSRRRRRRWARRTRRAPPPLRCWRSIAA